jgi:hypothetical protein
VKKLIGPLILLLVALAVGVWKWTGGGPARQLVEKPLPQQVVHLSGYVGGEKMRLLADPEVTRLLKDGHGVTLDAVKAGSIEMADSLPLEGKDLLWPSNQIATELFRRRGGAVLAEETVFNSPIVLYTYDIVADALIKAGIVEKQSEVYYLVDLPKLVTLIRGGKKWADIGLPQLYGQIAILSTDPTRSNSGNIFAGLLANMLNGGEVVTPDHVDDILPDLIDYFSKRGYMEHSSGDIFKSFITTGVGAKPLIVGYENQLIEFALENENTIDFLTQKVRTLYPIPTVWSRHPVIALTENGRRLIDALNSEPLQQVAWRRHGFRSGRMGVVNNPAELPVSGIPTEITAVMPMPGADVMQRIIAALRSEARP